MRTQFHTIMMRPRLVLMAIAACGAVTSAAQKNYEVGNPDNEDNYGYLQHYLPLKEYVDREAYPNFKVGIAISAGDYQNNATVKAVANNYFDEVVTGNDMKMSSCVRGDGTMDFTTVKNFVNAASKAGLNLYGHTLAWHSQQATGWLTKLIQDRKPDTFESNTTVWTDLATKDFTQNKSLGWTASKDTYGFSTEFTADGLHVTTTKKCNQWEVQYQVMNDIPTEKNVSYRITFTIKGSKGGKLTCKLGDWSSGPNTSFNFTTEWQEMSVTLKSTTEGSFLLLQHGEFVGDLWIKDIRIEQQTPAWQDEEGNITLPAPVPLTAEQKHDTLVYAMGRWIQGIMNATAGKVKAWDVVNEAIAGSDKDGDGIYDLQHGDSEGCFYWPVHMGDLEYVRQAVALARKYYAEAMANRGGDDGQLKLFMNDYNLESDWDGNKKLKSLIEWIKRWEADGVTRIDGIGTQMHISCYANSTTQNNKKKAIENSFKLMAATGKLVRISELDMGMVDANGKDVPTDKMTETHHKRMASLYEWVIKKYLEIVPPEQQWGICQWCATDSPSNSGWRPDTPVGLWDGNWYRKHTYAGFARGLGAPKDPSPVAVPDAAPSEAPSAVYDLSGRRIATTTPANLPHGLYIINGVKVAIK